MEDLSKYPVDFSVVYASQTGNAEDMAYSVYDEAIKRGLNVEITGFQDLTWEYFTNSKMLVFVCSTTGVGDEPDTMKEFWKLLLRKSLPRNLLTHLRYAVFGLGDSSYEKYNFVAKKLFRRLGMLGGNAIMELGLGDDQHYLGPYYSFSNWINAFFSNINSPPLKDSVGLDRDNLFSPTTHFLLAECDKVADIPKQHLAPISGREGWGTVVKNERITSTDHFQDVRSLVIEPNYDECRWNPGDYVSITPQNSAADAQKFLDMMGYSSSSTQNFFYSRNRIRHGVRPLTQTDFASSFTKIKCAPLIDIVQQE
ncbi:NADPH-dependent diflavin oxidoreductase 1, partial [Smittium mucronatum]